MNVALIGYGKMGQFLAHIMSPHCRLLIVEPAHISQKCPSGTKNTTQLEDVLSFEPDWIVNAVPLHLTVSIFRKLEPMVGAHCVRIDIASVKTEVAAYYQQAHVPYFSMHPMFGPTFADMSHLQDEQVVFISGSESQPAIAFSKWFGDLGLKIVTHSFEEHDRLIATGLSLPFLMTLGFSIFRNRPTLPGSTYHKLEKIASAFLREDPALISEILLNPHSKWLIDEVVDQLVNIRRLVDKRDGPALERLIKKMMLQERLP